MRPHPASDALRSRSPERLRADLLATLVDGEEVWLTDDRDLMVELAPFHDCARRLGLDPAAVFEDAARRGPASLSDTVRTFGTRTDVTPRAFGYTLSEDGDGPAYTFAGSDDTLEP